MKIRRSTHLLAVLFALLGLGWFMVVPKFLLIFVDLGMPLPPFTRVALAPTEVGWLLISWFLAALVLWKDLRPHAWLRNSIFSVVLVLEVITVVTALFLPLMTVGPGLGS